MPSILEYLVSMIVTWVVSRKPQVELPVSEHWLLTYNHERPHDSLGAVPTLTFLPRPSSPGPSPYRLST